MQTNILKRGGAFALAITIVVLIMFSLPARAGQQTQTDTNFLTAFSTNTYKITGDTSGSFTNGQTFPDAQTISGAQTTQLFASVGGFWTNTTASSSNVIYKIASSVDGANWSNSAPSITLTIPANTTNWVVGMFPITSPYPQYCLRATENANGAAVAARANTIFFKVWSKTGL